MVCDNALPGLVADLKAAFPGTDLSDLSPSDLKSPGQISTVDSLVEFIANSQVTLLETLAASIKADHVTSGKKAGKKAGGKSPSSKKAAKKSSKGTKKNSKGGMK